MNAPRNVPNRPEPAGPPLPFAGMQILVPRPRDQADALRRRLAALGAEVLVQPAIEISDPPDWTPVDAALDRLDSYDWLVFSSVNGVDYLLGRLVAREGSLRRLVGRKLAAIGPATADALRARHLEVDLVPDAYRAEALAQALVERFRSAGEDEPESPRFLLARASRGREVLAEQLAAAGARVDQVVVYSSTDVTQPDGRVAAALTAGQIDWVAVTSSAIARSLVSLFGEPLRRARLASISPVTSETLRSLGHEPAAEAAEYTTEGLIQAILAAHGEPPPGAPGR